MGDQGISVSTGESGRIPVHPVALRLTPMSCFDGIVHLPCSDNLHTYSIHPPLLRRSRSIFLLFTFNLELYCTSKDITISSSQHFLTHTVCHGQLIYCFIQIHHQHQILDVFIHMSYTTHFPLNRSFCLSQKSHFKDGILKACDEVCGKKKGEVKEIHGGGMKR